MKVRYLGKSFGVDGLTDGKVYEVLEYDERVGALRVADDSGEGYLYSPVHPRPIAVPGHAGGIWEIVEDDAQGTLANVIHA